RPTRLLTSTCRRFARRATPCRIVPCPPRTHLITPLHLGWARRRQASPPPHHGLVGRYRLSLISCPPPPVRSKRTAPLLLIRQLPPNPLCRRVAVWLPRRHSTGRPSHHHHRR